MSAIKIDRAPSYKTPFTFPRPSTWDGYVGPWAMWAEQAMVHPASCQDLREMGSSAKLPCSGTLGGLPARPLKMEVCMVFYSHACPDLESSEHALLSARWLSFKTPIAILSGCLLHLQWTTSLMYPYHVVPLGVSFLCTHHHTPMDVNCLEY